MLRSALLLALLLAAAEGYPAATLQAQSAATLHATSRDDSVRALRTARSRQASFERARRRYLPWTWSGGSGPCDERIGRFCLTYSAPDRPEWEPPEEREAIVQARARLLEELAAAALVIPGDEWIAGQRVRYMVEARDLDGAGTTATSCLGTPWWCAALRGYVSHHAGEAETSQAAFDSMLASMPPREQRRWTDLTQLLEPSTARRYRRLDEQQQAAFERRFWALSVPLHQTRGNALRSEHLSRNLLATLQQRSETTEDLSWGDDLREILIRFGAPSGWERIRDPYTMHRQEVSLVSHYPDADVDLLPPDELLAEDALLTAGLWDEEGRRARASYPLPRGDDRLRWFTPFDHQFALLHDADSALLVAAYDLPSDSLDAPGSVDGALVALGAGLDAPRMTRHPAAGAHAALTLALPYEPVLISLEAFAPGEGRAGRARRGLSPTPLVAGVLAASDLLLLHLEEDTPTESRDEALRLARGSTRLAAGERVGVYWEMYSPGATWPDAIEVGLRLVESDSGWLRRLAQRIGVVRELEPIRLSWGDAVRGSETIARSLALSIPDDARPGRYSLELTLTAPGREPLIVSRTIDIEP